MAGRTAGVMIGLCLMAMGLGRAPLCVAADPPAAATGSPTVILDTSGFWRMHHTLARPVIRFDDGLKPIDPAGAEASVWIPLVAKPTASAPQGWTAPEFDDGGWYRGTGAATCKTPYLSRLCLRGKFTVTDPAKAAGLTLSLDYYGGAVVYVNGQEIPRQHVPAGALAEGDLAQEYPEEAFVDENGGLIALRGNEPLLMKDKVSQETAKRIGSRTRSLSVPIPANLLRAGTNVVAVELVRAPYHKVLDAHKVKQTYKSDALTHDMSWNTCELRRIQLTSAAGAAVVANAVRPEGVQVWNSDPLATDFDLDFGDRVETLQPIRLVGARNGTYSGKVVVGSTQPIRGLKATPADLVTPGGDKIPASRIRIRYAFPSGEARTTNEGNTETSAYPAEALPFFALGEAPLAEYPVREKKLADAEIKPGAIAGIIKYSIEAFPLRTPGQPVPVSGAVVPVWVTVSVPKDSRPGAYAGKVAIQADGRTVADVPVEVKVVDWTLPDPGEQTTWVELVQSPDTLAIEYGVPLWSEKHFQLIAHSMKYLGEIGSRVLYVPLIAHTNLGNAESMVRWVKKADGTYGYDFSILEKYLEAAEKNMGKPKIVCFNVWDLYLYRSGGKAYAYVGSQTQASADKNADKGPLVTVVDSSGKVENISLPPDLGPASKALWKPLFDELRQRMARHGLEQTMMLGMITDAWASQEQVQFFKDIGADLPWVSASHGRHNAVKGANAMYGIADVGYQAHAFGADFGYSQSIRGWSLPGLDALYERWAGFPSTMISRWRHFGEYSITGRQRGIGRVGAEFWTVIKDKGGVRRGRVWEQCPESNWRQLSLVTSVLAPGPDCAVATAKFEAIREGVQECEARIVIERALGDKDAAAKLGEDLVGRCKAAIDERHRDMWLSYSTLQVGPRAEHAFAAWRGCYFAGVAGYRWFLSSGWQARSELLYSLAGEVSKSLAAK